MFDVYKAQLIQLYCTDITGKVKVKPWVKHNWQIPEHALTSTVGLNETLGMWESLKIRLRQIKAAGTLPRFKIRS
jgi:hypothetical protein